MANSGKSGGGAMNAAVGEATTRELERRREWLIQEARRTNVRTAIRRVAPGHEAWAERVLFEALKEGRL